MPKANPTTIVLAGGAVLLVAPTLYKGLKQTVIFFRSLGGGAKRQARIDGYDAQHAADAADGRNANYGDLVDSYYDLATDFYEWGWGTSFHFADRRANETFKQSMARHEVGLSVFRSSSVVFGVPTRGDTMRVPRRHRGVEQATDRLAVLEA